MDNKINKQSLSVRDSDWYISEKTLSRAASLISFLMKKYSIDLNHVIRHYDVTHKLCPRPLVGDDINTYYGITGNERWAAFKQQINEKL
jgi:N-acetylmuramoyl-L-alanine amidase CwlA